MLSRPMGTTSNVINEAELREMTPGERRELARALAQLDYPHPLLDLNLQRAVDEPRLRRDHRAAAGVLDAPLPRAA